MQIVGHDFTSALNFFFLSASASAPLPTRLPPQFQKAKLLEAVRSGRPSRASLFQGIKKQHSRNVEEVEQR